MVKTDSYKIVQETFESLRDMLDGFGFVIKDKGGNPTYCGGSRISVDFVNKGGKIPLKVMEEINVELIYEKGELLVHAFSYGDKEITENGTPSYNCKKLYYGEFSPVTGPGAGGTIAGIINDSIENVIAAASQ